jgi:hypothetical protein
MVMELNKIVILCIFLITFFLYTEKVFPLMPHKFVEHDDFLKIDLEIDNVEYTINNINIKKNYNNIYIKRKNLFFNAGILRDTFKNETNYCTDILCANLNFDIIPYILISNSPGPKMCTYYISGVHDGGREIFSDIAIETMERIQNIECPNNRICLANPYFNKKDREIFILLSNGIYPMGIWLAYHEGKYKLKEILSTFNIPYENENCIAKKINTYYRDNFVGTKIFDADTGYPIKGTTTGITPLRRIPENATHPAEILPAGINFQVIDAKVDKEFHLWIKIKTSDHKTGWTKEGAPISFYRDIY